MNKPKVFTIIGPTASGKTSLSIELAEKISKQNGKEVEIISADSRQVYKYIPIATAQPSKDILRKFKHYFVSELEIENEFNAGEFGKQGREIISSIFDSGKIPIIVGGSGLYIDSLVNGLFDYNDLKDEKDFKQNKEKIRIKLYDELNNYGSEKLLSDLKKADPDTVNSMPHITDRRIIRALEVYYLTGIPISVHRNKKIDIEFEAVKIGIYINRDILYERINKRVDLMIKEGLIDEVKLLRDKGYHYKDFNSLNTVGIKEVFDRLEDKISFDRMVELIKQNTRRFAKRQLAWFRRYNDIQLIKSADEINLIPFISPLSTR